VVSPDLLVLMFMVVGFRRNQLTTFPTPLGK